MRVILPGSEQMANRSVSEWTPPDDPDPEAILSEACDDTNAQRYEDALAKHLWFHNEALRYQPSLSGVRVSFALGFWLELAEVYSPAMRELERIRDETRQKVLNSDVQRLRDLFLDFQGMNRTLQAESETTALFIQLDRDNPDRAEQVFVLALPSLLRSQEYKLCGKYLNPMERLRREIKMFHFHEDMARQPRNAKSDIGNVGRQMFTNHTSVLVALLVVNDRKPEAVEVVELAKKEWSDAGFHAALDKALTGEIPKPWP